MLSIITINKDNSAGLRKTIESLQHLDHKQFQWVCIDSVSTDGSVQLAQEFQSQNDIVISEKDSGIYNAMNKGILHAKENYILFLNSGDILSPEIQNLEFMKIVQGYDIALFGFKIRNSVRKPRSNSWRFWSMPTSHQAIVYSRSLLQQHPFDEGYRFAADFEHYLRINRSPIAIYSNEQALIVNEPYGSDGHLPILLNEYRDALVKNGYPRLWAHLVYWMKTHYLKWALRERSS